MPGEDLPQEDETCDVLKLRDTLSPFSGTFINTCKVPKKKKKRERVM